MLVVPCLGRRGGLAMLWKEEVDLNIQTYNQNHINTLILTKQNVLEDYWFLWETRRTFEA